MNDGKAPHFLALYGNGISALCSMCFISEHVASCTSECNLKLFQIYQCPSTHLIVVEVISISHIEVMQLSKYVCELNYEVYVFC
jgi:hypothetical protein